MTTSSLYVKLDVNYDDDPAIIEAGEKAELLYLRGLALAKRTLSDGFIADVQLGRMGLPGVKARAQRLVDVNLWIRDDDLGGYVIRTWSKRNKSKAEVEQLVETRAEAGKKGGIASGQSRRGKQLASDSANQSAEPNPNQTPNPETEQRQSRAEQQPLGDAVPAPQETTGPPARPPRPPDPIWEALIDVCGLSGQEPTPSARGAWNKAAAELRGLKATPDEIRDHARAFRRRWPDVSMTPSALARRWAEAVADTPTPDPVRTVEIFDLDDHYERTAS